MNYKICETMLIALEVSAFCKVMTNNKDFPHHTRDKHSKLLCEFYHKLNKASCSRD